MAYSKGYKTGYKSKWNGYKKPEPTAKVGRKTITPSTYQSAVFKYILGMLTNRNSKHLIVKAVAGSGKTTTLIEALYQIIDEFGNSISAIFLAFNKKIATELESRLPIGFQASTLHSFGLKAFGKTKVQKDKVMETLKTYLDIQDGRTILDSDKRLVNKEKWVKAFFVLKLVSLCKNKAILPEQVNFGLIDNLTDYYDIDGQVTDEIVHLTKYALTQSNILSINEKVIDFDDMIYIPAIYNLTPKGYDLALVDEAQDLNESQLLLLENMVKANPRMKLVFVGDENQAIYGFRGAGTESMEIIRKRFECHELPLSVSYRCGKAIIAHAQQIVPSILPFDGAREGAVETIPNQEQAIDLCKELLETLAVVCRANAPLVPFAYTLMREGLPVVIIGRDIAEGLIKLVDKVSDNKNLPLLDFVTQLTNWADREVQKYQASRKADKAEEIRDKEATLLAFTENVNDVEGLKARILSIYKDTENDKTIVENSIKLMTIHKSKGLEFETVGILPSKQFTCKNDWQQKQEANMLYVARTRAIDRLVYFPERA